MSTLVLGVGNVLLSDEAVGIRAVEELERRFCLPADIEVLDGGCSGIELLRFIAEHDHLLIIDAVNGGHPPGTVLRVEGEDVPKTFMTRMTPHQIGITDLLAAARLTDEMPEHLVLFGVQPKSFEMALGLTAEVQASMNRLLEVVVEELRSYGHEISPRAEGSPETLAVSRWV